MFALLALNIACAACTSQEARPIQLVKASRISRLTLMTLPQAVFPDFRSRSLPQFDAFRRCVDSTSEAKFDSIFERAIDASLSAEELGEAIDFYEGATGRKLSDSLVASALDELDQRPHRGVQFSAAEEAEISIFARSSSGKKLAFDALVAKPEIRSELDSAEDEVIRLCGEGSIGVQ